MVCLKVCSTIILRNYNSIFANSSSQVYKDGAVYYLLIDQGTLMHTSRANFISVCGLALTQLLLAQIRPPSGLILTSK